MPLGPWNCEIQSLLHTVRILSQSDQRLLRKHCSKLLVKIKKFWQPFWNTIVEETSKFRRQEDGPRDQLRFASSPESIRALVPEIMILACFQLLSTNQNPAKSQVPQNPTSVFSWWVPPPKPGVVCLMRGLFFFNLLKIHLFGNLPFWYFLKNGAHKSFNLHPLPSLWG